MTAPAGGIDAYVKSVKDEASASRTHAPQASDPANPATGAITYAKVVSGKVKLYAIFPTGGPVLIATEA